MEYGLDTEWTQFKVDEKQHFFYALGHGAKAGHLSHWELY